MTANEITEQYKEQNNQTDKSKNRATLISLVAVFVAPVLFAYLAYFGGWFTGGTKNKGELIENPWHIEDVSILEYSFGDWKSSPYMGKWNWLLVLDQASCNEACQINWFLLQQTRLGMAKKAEKVNYLLVLNQNKSELTGDWADIDVARAQIDGGQLSVANDELKGFNTQSMPANAIYLMDPLGNIFMKYDLIKNKDDAPLFSKDLRTDIGRVMRFLDVNQKR